MHSFNTNIERETRNPSHEYPRHVKQKQKKCVTTYGTLELVMSNIMAKKTRVACASITKTGGMS
jgi:hypothetical protein